MSGATATVGTAMSIRDFLSPQAVVTGLDIVAKKDTLLYIAEHIAECAKLDGHAVFDVLWARERLGTTGVGAGIAIPHGRVAGVQGVCGYFVRLHQPIAFEAIDDKPVDLIFTLLSPEGAGADHLRALATVSRLLREAKLCEALRKAPDSAAMYKLLTEATIAEQAA